MKFPHRRTDAAGSATDDQAAPVKTALASRAQLLLLGQTGSRGPYSGHLGAPAFR